MTMVLTYTNRDVVVQASDRRLTRGGAVFDDFSTKSVILHCRNATAVLSYTGLAFVGQHEDQRTDHWLVDALSSIDAGRVPFLDVLERLRGAVHDVLEATPPPWSQKGLTVAFSGFAFSGLPFVAALSNELQDDCTTPRAPSGNVIKWAQLSSVSEELLLAYGAEVPAYLSQRLSAQAIGGVFRGMPIEGISAELVAVIREASDDPSVGGLVGKDCHTVYMSRAGRIRLHDYRMNSTLPRSAKPHVVGSGFAIADMELARVAPSPSANIPAADWPVLDAALTCSNSTVRIENGSDAPWTEIRLDVNGGPDDLQKLAIGLVGSTGYIYRLPSLAAHTHVEFGLQALRRIPDGRALRLDATIESWVLTARLPSGLLGMCKWPDAVDGISEIGT